ncbi:MAG: LytR C-terminal domain-containing protein [Marmoricola sp.]
MNLTDRRTTSAITLAVTALVVVVMAFWGLHALTAPVAKDPSSASTSPDDAASCPAGQTATVVRLVKRSQVRVSVYNAGKRSGRAGATLNLLESAGFLPGAIGNAPDGTTVDRAQVHTKKADDAAAKLVALAFGPNTEVVVDDGDLGPGVNVYIGDKFRKLDRSAPRSEKLTKPVVTCS